MSLSEIHLISYFDQECQSKTKTDDDTLLMKLVAMIHAWHEARCDMCDQQESDLLTEAKIKVNS